MGNDQKNSITSAIVSNEVFTKNRRSYSFDKAHSSEIRKFLIIEPLLFRSEESQLKRFGLVSRMPQEIIPKQTLLAKANAERAVGRPTAELHGPITLGSILNGFAWDFIKRNGIDCGRP